MVRKTATVGPVEQPMNLRKAYVDLDGENIGFWVDNLDHPFVKPGTEVTVEFDPQDQFARIVA